MDANCGDFVHLKSYFKWQDSLLGCQDTLCMLNGLLYNISNAQEYKILLSWNMVASNQKEAYGRILRSREVLDGYGVLLMFKLACFVVACIMYMT